MSQLPERFIGSVTVLRIDAKDRFSHLQINKEYILCCKVGTHDI